MTMLRLIQGGKAMHVHGENFFVCLCIEQTTKWIEDLERMDRTKEASSLKHMHDTVWYYPPFSAYSNRLVLEWPKPEERALLAHYIYWAMHNVTGSYCPEYCEKPSEQEREKIWITAFSYEQIWPTLSGNQRKSWLSQQKHDFHAILEAMHARQEDDLDYLDLQEMFKRKIEAHPEDARFIQQAHAFTRALLICRHKYFLELEAKKLTLDSVATP